MIGVRTESHDHSILRVIGDDRIGNLKRATSRRKTLSEAERQFRSAASRHHLPPRSCPF